MCPGDTWWSHLQCPHQFDHNVPSGDMVITFTMSPVAYIMVSFTMFFTMYSACPWATHWEFFQKLFSDVITMYSTTCSLSSLRIHGKNQLHWGYIVITLKEAPWGHWGHISGQFLKELSMSGSGTCWTHCEEHCERNHYVSHWGHCDHIDGHILNELNMCPLSTLWMWSPYIPWAHWSHMAGYILNVISICPLGTLYSHNWVHFECIWSLPTGYIVITYWLDSQCIQHVPTDYWGPCP